MAQQVHHVKVVFTFLKGGVSLNKIDQFRELLQDNAFHLTDRHHCMIVFLSHRRRTFFSPRNYWKIIFDGTSRLGEDWQLLCVI